MTEQWTADKETSGQPAYIYSGMVAKESRIVGKIYRKADAAFIVKAVNNHDALVKALTELCEAFEWACDQRSPVAIEARRVLGAVGGPANG